MRFLEIGMADTPEGMVPEVAFEPFVVKHRGNDAWSETEIEGEADVSSDRDRHFCCEIWHFCFFPQKQSAPYHSEPSHDKRQSIPL
jgi:hypothetical protein